MLSFAITSGPEFSLEQAAEELESYFWDVPIGPTREWSGTHDASWSFPLHDPLLLMGPPGVGKSHFAQAMARAFGTEASTLHFDAGITNSALLEP